jgi:hypothetical protein
MGRFGIWLSCGLALFPSVVRAEFADGVTLRCSTPLLYAHASSAAEAEAACQAAVVAHEHLVSLGLSNSSEVQIEVTETLPVGQGHCVAMYDTASDIIHVLSGHCLEGNPGEARPISGHAR